LNARSPEAQAKAASEVSRKIAEIKGLARLSLELEKVEFRKGMVPGAIETIQHQLAAIRNQVYKTALPQRD